MSNFNSPLYNKDKSLSQNVEELFNGMGDMARALNKERASSARNVIFANGASSGTATVPLDTARHTLLLAVIGGTPVLCALYNGTLNGYGYGEHISGTLAKTSLEYSASGTLDALIVIM